MNDTKIIRNLIEKIKNNNIEDIKYFHPNGGTLPNGSYYQRGGFLQECYVNRNAFELNEDRKMFSVINGVITEGVNDEQYGLSDYHGGIIVFSTDVNALKMSNNVIINKVKQTLLSFSNRLNKNKILGNIVNKFNKEQEGYIGAFSIGKYFKGRYVSDNGKIYNETSTTIEINGISSVNLLKIAEFICQEFKQETVLVKDLNLNKIYLANPNKSDDFDLSNINTQSQL